MNPYNLKRRTDEASSGLDSPMKRRRSSRIDMMNSNSGRTGKDDGHGKAEDTFGDGLTIGGKVNAVSNTITPSFRNVNPFDREAGSGRGTGSAMTLGGIPLNDLRLGVDPNLSQTSWDQITSAMEEEILRQIKNPPVLPESQVPDLAPKAKKIPLDTAAAGEMPEAVELRNNDIAETNKSQDRERNNMAAKKSRDLRLEAVRESRRMLNEKEAEIAWYRLYILSTGGSVSGWDNMDPAFRVKIIEEIAKRVTEVDEVRKEHGKAVQRAGRIAFQVWSVLEKQEEGESITAEDERMLSRYEAEIKLRRDALHRSRTGQPPQTNDEELILHFDKFLTQACLRESSGERDPDTRDRSVERRLSLASPAASRRSRVISRPAPMERSQNKSSCPVPAVPGSHHQTTMTPANIQQLWEQASMPYLQGGGSHIALPNVPIVNVSGPASVASMPTTNTLHGAPIIGARGATPAMDIRDLNIQQPATTMASSTESKPQVGCMGNNSGILNPYGIPSSFNATQAPPANQAPQAVPDPQNWAYMSSSTNEVPDQFIDPTLTQIDPELPSSAMQGHDDFLGSLAGPEDWQANPFADKDST